MKEFSPFRLDAADQSLWRGEQRVPLTPKAFAVLCYLVERAGRLVTQNELLEALWPDTFVQPEVLKSQILDVRTALGDRAKEPRFIETLSRRGYRFIAPVREVTTAEPAAAQSGPGKLVGRDSALAELRGCIKKASSGERQIVFVTGEQGMGKTTLVDAFLQEVSESGVEIVRGQCLEGFGVAKEPYYPVLEALGQLSRGTKRESLIQVLETQAPTWLIQLPALLRREHRDVLQRELLGATSERMIRELCEALERLTGESTLVLLLEDLHWTDHSTVDLIAAIAHRRSPARLLLIGTYRPVDVVLAQHPLKQVSHSLKARRLSREIALAPLVETEVAEYLSRQAGAVTSAEDSPLQHLARWIQKQTEGNPLFMVTVVEHLLELGHIALNESAWTVATPLDQIEISVPDTLRQIDRLSPREQLALDAASVHGIGFSAAVVAAALEIDAEGVEDTCQKLAQQNHIVRAATAEQAPDGTFSQRYEFVHAAFRHVFYHRLAPARRAKLHRRFGETIESARTGDRAEVAAELAGHFEQCADWPKTVEYLSLVAKNAWRRFDYPEAISILEQAMQAAGKLHMSERMAAETRTLLLLATLQHGLHDTARVIPTLEALVARAEAYAMPDVGARALVALAAMKSHDDCRACLPLLDQLQSLITKQTDPVAQAQARAHWACMRITMFGWDARLAEEHAAALAQIGSGGDRLATALVLADHCFLQWTSTQYADSFKNAQESLPLLLETGRLVRFFSCRDLMAMNLTFLERWGAALDILDETIHDAYKNEAPLRLAMPLLFKAWVHLNAMDYKSVLEMCEQARPYLKGPYLRDFDSMERRLAASADLGLGRHDSAWERFEELRSALDQRPFVLGWYWRMPMQLGLAEASLAKGDLAQARAEANRSLDLALGMADRTWQALAWDGSARVALQEADWERMESNLKNGLGAMRGFDVPLAAWRVHATTAKTHRRNGNTELERSHLASSRSVLLALAKSLDSRPALKQVFLSSTFVSELLGDDIHSQAAS